MSEDVANMYLSKQRKPRGMPAGRTARVALSVVLMAVLLMGASSPAWAAPRTVDWPDYAVRVSVDAQRIGGDTRYDTAAEIARAAYPGWVDVDHVIVSSGLDRSMADPLAAAGLCWAYNAPLLLVGDATVPTATKAALQEIVSVNDTITVTVIGSTSAVSAACMDQIESIVGEGNVERPFAGADRYATAAMIALHVSEVASESATLEASDIVLVANGTDERDFADALALSAVSAATGAPVLFVTENKVPASTSDALDVLEPSETIVAGSEVVVSASTYGAVGATDRWYGSDRYATAVAIADNARSRGWLSAPTFGLAASVPDALVGATYMGKIGAPLLHTPKYILVSSVARYAEAHEDEVLSCIVFGSTAAISSSVFDSLEGSAAAPVLVTPLKGYVAKYAVVSVKTGVNTSRISLYIDDELVDERDVGSFKTVELGRYRMPSESAEVRVVVTNPEDKAKSKAITVRPLTYPASTCIVIDKSDFKLYWVKADVLLATYPVAIGRVGMETPVAMWKILAKYYTDPDGVYGPRKMRLYRQYGSSYVYTAYAIHGTNEPWVIGTKASHGCVRMYNADVLRLFPQVPLGTLVQTRE